MQYRYRLNGNIYITSEIDCIPIGLSYDIIEVEVPDINQIDIIEENNKQFEINLKKIERETILKNGVFVQYFWFNEYYLAQFISLIGVCERENKQVEWKNTKHEWVFLLIHEANSIAFQASMKFQEIYKNT